MENSKTLTMEYLLANTDYTEADFAGVDFDAFVAWAELTEESATQFDLLDLLRMYRKELADVYTDYTGLYQGAEGKLREEDLDQLAVVLWELHSGNDNAYMVLDLEKNAVYFSADEIISACRDSDKVAELAGREDVLKAALRDNDIFSWENSYVGTDEGTTESWSWSVAVKLADGRNMVYSGRGISGSGTPAGVTNLFKTLKNAFVTK